MITVDELRNRQSLRLDEKIELSIDRICEFYDKYNGDVYVAFSGGKDSTALLHLVREMYPDIEAVFVDTGLEYPEIREFVRTVDNVTWLKPTRTFANIIEKYGYPVISKTVSMGLDRYANAKDDLQRELRLTGGTNPTSGRPQQRTIPKKYHYLIDAPFKCSDRCCYFIKKAPLKSFEKESGKKPFIGTMASDSMNRERVYLRNGCNAYDTDSPQSTPLAFWTQVDIWEYINGHDVLYSNIYDMGEENTGCMFCMFGIMYDGNPNRFQRMLMSHPKQYDYCINKLGIGNVLDYIGIEYK